MCQVNMQFTDHFTENPRLSDAQVYGQRHRYQQKEKISDGQIHNVTVGHVILISSFDQTHG